MEFFLGVDGGQSSTTALIGDAAGRVIGSAIAGPCNHVSSAEAVARFTHVSRTCISDACRSAGLDLNAIRFEAAVCGMSGGPEDKKTLLARIIPTDHLIVTNDAEIALAGATGGGPGLIVIAGTGSIALGREASGKLIRAGGWGYVFGDEGGAFDLVRQALRAALRFEEGWGPPTAIRVELLNATGIESANNALHLFYTADWPRSRVAQLAPLIDRVALEGDAIARSILENAAQQLASLASSVRSRLDPGSGPLPASYIGGVFHSRILLERFRLLVELTDSCECVSPKFDPSAGALLLAYRTRDRAISLSGVPTLK